MLQATKNKYGIETLKELNVLYDREHWLTQEDVDMANSYVELIERTRSEITPQVGDSLIFLSRHGDYYGNALIDSADEKKGLLSICEKPYAPFVWQAAESIRLCVSGGAFHLIKKDDLKFNGWTEGAFKDWGHCGACANGAVTFMAKVLQWIYREPEPLYGDFTTETYRRFHLHKDTEARNLYQCFDIAFHTEEDFQQFLQDYEGMVFKGNWEGQIVVWCFRQEYVFLSPEEWEKVDAPITERILNCHPEKVKLVKDIEQHITRVYRINSQNF